MSEDRRTSLRDYVIVGVYLASVAVLTYIFYGDIVTYVQGLETQALFLKGFVVAGILLATYLSAKFVDRLLKRLVLITEYSEVIENLAVRLAVMFIWIVGIFLVVSQFQVDTGSLVAGFGVIGLALSFAARDTLGNFFAGALITLDTPFDVGDWIQVGESGKLYGVVEDIDVFRTYITTRDWVNYSIPNEKVMSETIINFTRPDEQYRVEFFLKVSFESDLRLARDIVLETVAEYWYLSIERPIWIFTDDLGDFARILRVRFFIPHIRLRRRARDYVLNKIEERFEEAGVVMPYPTQQVILEGEGQKMGKKVGGG